MSEDTINTINPNPLIGLTQIRLIISDRKVRERYIME